MSLLGAALPGLVLRSPAEGGAVVAPQTKAWFTDVAGRSKFDYRTNNDFTGRKYFPQPMCGGVAAIDYDGDGWMDLFFTNGARLPTLKKASRDFMNCLLRNNRDGTFEDVTERAGLKGEDLGFCFGVAAADYDNDGRQDLFLCNAGRNALYHNNGDGTFTDVTAGSGLDVKPDHLLSVGAAWFDYDNDGLLDLFVTNYLDWSLGTSRVCGDDGKRLSCSPSLYSGLPNLLYRNNGDGTFTEVSRQTGIAEHIGKGMSVAVADFDDDGFMDVFVANDQARNFLLKNVEGQRFTEIGVEAGVAYSEDGLPLSSMGVDFRDLNEDGRPDLIVTALGGETFPLYLNSGHRLFESSSYPSGLGFQTLRMSGWGVGAYDFDNDGHKDLFTANSHVSENADFYGRDHYRQPNALFRNLGNGQFENVTPQAGSALQSAAAHRGCAFGDLNNDGRMDVVVSAIGEPAKVLYNVCSPENHWILIQLQGTRSNRDAIGAKIKITSDSGQVQYNHVTTAVGYASASDKRVHFGLGAVRRIREIEIRWPSGHTQTLKDIAANQILMVKEK